MPFCKKQNVIYHFCLTNFIKLICGKLKNYCYDQEVETFRNKINSLFKSLVETLTMYYKGKEKLGF